jgi:hypothetical protein
MLIRGNDEEQDSSGPQAVFKSIFFNVIKFAKDICSSSDLHERNKKI